MTTWVDLLADIKADIADDGTRWSDTALYLYAKDAIRDYSTYFPRRFYRVELVGSEGVYTLPSDFVADIAVECPKETYLERRYRHPGARFKTLSRPIHYYVEGGTLYVNGPPLDGDPVLLSYNALHEVPSAVNDDTFVLTVPAMDEELIRLYVKAKAFENLSGQQSVLDRFKLGGSKRTDNPVFIPAEDLMEDYLRKIAERTTGGSIELWRPGRPR
jgi:hypothetical protein